MRKSILAGCAIVALGLPSGAAAQNDSWLPISFNESRIAVGWVQVSSYATLNENSFRLNSKFTNDQGIQVVGRIDVNCKNKDFYFRPNGVLAQSAPWAAIPSGSGLESIGRFFCKRTAARSDWGYTDETKYLWSESAPRGDAGDAKGEWLLANETDESENYYNTAVVNKGTHLLVATWARSKKGERSAATPGDTQGYMWTTVDCLANRFSVFLKPDLSVEGTWLTPTAGRPGGLAMKVKKQFCSASQ